jgi:hypothetical protein
MIRADKFGNSRDNPECVFPRIAPSRSTGNRCSLTRWAPANRSEAIAILQRYTKHETAVMEAVYDLFIAKDKLYTADAAVDSAGVDAEIATMIEKGVLPAGTVMLPRDYMLPRELGGLYR